MSYSNPMANFDTTAFLARLDECVRLVGGKKAELAERAGLTPPALAKYKTGSEPGLSALVGIAKAAGVSIDWLATGREPWPTERRDPAGPEKHDDVTIPVLLPGTPDSKPRRALKFSRVGAKVQRDIAERVFPDTELGSLALCQIHDSGCQPELRKGEWIVIDTSKRNLFEGLGAFRFGDQVTIRGMHLIESDGSTPQKCELTSRMRDRHGAQPHLITQKSLGDYIDLLGEVVRPAAWVPDEEMAGGGKRTDGN